MVVGAVDLLGAWDRVRSGALAVQLLSAQFGVVRRGAVRNGSVVVICCREERKAMVLCPRDGGDGDVPLLRTVVLTSSDRGARVDDAVLSSCKFMREAVVPLLRGGEVTFRVASGRSVPLG